LGIILWRGDDTAPLWLLYLAAALICLAVVMMVMFFMSSILRRYITAHIGKAAR
jgi:ABC-type glycerol-3-phosphate transport system permease component